MPVCPPAACLTIKQTVEYFAAQTPEAVFFIAPETGKTVTWRALAAAMPPVSALAESLHVPPGAPLAYMMGNGWAAVQTLLGGLHGGRVMLPLNSAAGDGQIAYALQQSGCRAVIADEAHRERLQTIIAGKNIAMAVIDRDDGAPSGAPSRPHTPAAEDRGLLMYTSGTTGHPKGVVHTQRSLLAGGGNVVTAHRLTAADRALCVLPLYHINAICVTVLAPLLSGGGVVMAHRYRTADFWAHIAAHACTWFSVVPTLITYLLQADEAPPPLPRLRFGRSAAAPLPPAAHKEFERRFQIPLIETMGLTETAAQILANPLPPAPRKSGSPGIACGNRVAALGADNTPLAAGEVGELAVQGDNVMREYNDNAEETAAAFTADGWLLTGDLGYYDEEGYFFITGRRKELIIKGGENIAPREIDEALMRHAQVADAAAFARPCERYGQRVEACVTLTAGARLTEDALRLHCENILGAFKSPDRIYFVENIPRGATGKVQRFNLPDIAAAAERE